MFERVRSVAGQAGRSYTLFVVLGVVLGLAVAPYAWSTASQPDGTIAVIPVEGTIDGESAQAYTVAMKRARENPEIDAVVLIVNSGGGSASASEEMYLQTKRTAAELPVVASVDAGALSGAYYTVAPADYIYAKPSSLVGSIGVLAAIPDDVEPNDVIATSGPNKLTGANQREFFALIESFQHAFIGAVVEQRGENLTLTRAELGQARIYGGAHAVQNGLVDHIGGREAAIRRAADAAGLADYRIAVFRPKDTEFVSRNNYLASSAPNKTMVPASTLIGDGSAPVVLLVPRSYVAEAIPERAIVDGTDLTNHTVSNASRVNRTSEVIRYGTS